MVSVLSVHATSLFSQDTKVTIEMQNATVREVINEIESQGQISILYNDELQELDKRISVSYKDQPIKDIFSKVLDEADLFYEEIVEDFVVIIPKTKITAQQLIKVQGQIKDAETGEPLPGANIVLKGTMNGTVSDTEGNYEINVPKQESVIVFSYVGYYSQEIMVGSQRVIDVQLELEPVGLDEIVVIGYGSVKKKDLTGSVASIQGTDISERNVPMVSQALQGTIPGLMITRDNNEPGSSSTIRIRGITTIGDSNPLILIDGVPANDINDLNPNDIESISVLKDAASASIYGARAAAGVILVTTKRPQTGQLSLDYNFSVGYETPTTLPEFADAVRYMKMVNELRWNDIGNISGGEYPEFSQIVIDNYAALHAENPDLYPDVDWMGTLLEDKAMRSRHLMNISAGTKTLKTRFSIGFDDVDGLYIGKNYKRITTRSNNDIYISDYLNATVDFYFKREISESPSLTQGQVLHSALTTAPVYAAIWSNGLIADCKDGTNAYGQLLQGGFNNYWSNNVGGKISLDLTPLDGLKISAVIAPDFNFYKRKEFLKQVPYTNWDDPNTYVGLMTWGRTNNLTEVRVDYYSITNQFLANYSKSFGDHNVDIMGGYENYYFFRESTDAFSDNMVFDSYPYLDLGNPNNLSAGGTAYENAYRSLFGRILYNYQRKYLLQANVRYDGSSRFHKDHRWGTFPSFSAGWVISEESFMDNLPIVSFLKLRASWGMLGNERIGNYPYQATINFTNALFYQGYNIIADQTAAQIAYAIPDISWETTEVLDLGFDVNFFDNKFNMTFDIYRKVTKDMLLALEIPDFMGFDNPDQNTGEMYTDGWDLSLGWRDKIGDFSYSVSANLSDFKSIMGDLGGIQFLGDMVKFEGSEFNEYYGYISEGLFQTEEEISASAVPYAGIMPGDIKYKDISGPEGEPDGIISPDYDRVLLGGSLPRYMYGANINLGYKGFDFSLILQGVGKMNAVWTNNMRQPYQSAWRNMPMTIEGKYWSVYNTPEQNAEATIPRFTYTNTSNNYAMSDFWMFNGSYLRVKNVVLGYTLPKKIVNKILLQNCRIYFNVSDLLSLDKYPKGWDPEVANTGYPITTSYMLGLSVKF